MIKVTEVRKDGYSKACKEAGEIVFTKLRYRGASFSSDEVGVIMCWMYFQGRTDEHAHIKQVVEDLGNAD